MQNLFIGKGNLADSPELKRINGRNGEFAVASMRVMFGRYGQNEGGDVEQIGGFWREVEIYGQKAEACAKLLRKGARVLVLGEERLDLLVNNAGVLRGGERFGQVAEADLERALALLDAEKVQMEKRGVKLNKA